MPVYPAASCAVSIHAPVRGATNGGLPFCFLIDVSIHAPVRGATTSRVISPASYACFNPRAREGRDYGQRAYTDMDAAVSIHAPVRGATWVSGNVLRFNTVSIHAPVRGATKVVAFIDTANIVSIHAPVRGATSKPMIADEAIKCFNPRAREGRDGFMVVVFNADKQFQSTRP